MSSISWTCRDDLWQYLRTRTERKGTDRRPLRPPRSRSSDLARTVSWRLGGRCVSGNQDMALAETGRATPDAASSVEFHTAPPCRSNASDDIEQPPRCSCFFSRINQKNLVSATTITYLGSLCACFPSITSFYDFFRLLFCIPALSFFITTTFLSISVICQHFFICYSSLPLTLLTMWRRCTIIRYCLKSYRVYLIIFVWRVGAALGSLSSARAKRLSSRLPIGAGRARLIGSRILKINSKLDHVLPHLKIFNLFHIGSFNCKDYT